MGKRGTRYDLALLAGSVTFSLCFGEVMARLLLPAPLPWNYPQLRYRSDKSLVFALRPNQAAYTADKPAQINERGLRGPVVPYERIPGKKRLLFLGDSIVFGYGVREVESLSAGVMRLLEDQGVHAEGINTAVPSYNTEQEVAFLETEGLRYKPDWVIVGTCWNDISPKSGVIVSEEGWLGETIGGNKSFLVQWAESPWGYALRNALKKSRLLYGVFQMWRSLSAAVSHDEYARVEEDVLEGRETPRVMEGWKRVGTSLHRLGELSKLHGFHALVVAFPIPMVMDRSYAKSIYPNRVRELAVENDLEFVDLTPVFAKAYRGHESLFIPYDPDHPNAAGHDLAAREVVSFILEFKEEQGGANR